jgi:hypothetical protein
LVGWRLRSSYGKQLNVSTDYSEAAKEKSAVVAMGGNSLAHEQSRKIGRNGIIGSCIPVRDRGWQYVLGGMPEGSTGARSLVSTVHAKRTAKEGQRGSRASVQSLIRKVEGLSPRSQSWRSSSLPWAVDPG